MTLVERLKKSDVTPAQAAAAMPTKKGVGRSVDTIYSWSSGSTLPNSAEVVVLARLCRVSVQAMVGFLNENCEFAQTAAAAAK